MAGKYSSTDISKDAFLSNLLTAAKHVMSAFDEPSFEGLSDLGNPLSELREAIKQAESKLPDQWPERSVDLLGSVAEWEKKLDDIQFELRKRAIDDIALGLIEPLRRKLQYVLQTTNEPVYIPALDEGRGCGCEWCQKRRAREYQIEGQLNRLFPPDVLQSLTTMNGLKLNCPACGAEMLDNTAFYVCQNPDCLKLWTPVPLTNPTQWREVKSRRYDQES
jgi:hypothetical protein